MTIPNYFPSSDSDGMFHDQLLQNWREAMRSQFKDFPETDRFVAIMAAYNLLRETIEAAFEAQPKVRAACLMEIHSSMGRISDWEKSVKRVAESQLKKTG